VEVLTLILKISAIKHSFIPLPKKSLLTLIHHRKVKKAHLSRSKEELEII